MSFFEADGGVDERSVVKITCVYEITSTRHRHLNVIVCARVQRDEDVVQNFDIKCLKTICEDSIASGVAMAQQILSDVAPDNVRQVMREIDSIEQMFRDLIEMNHVWPAIVSLPVHTMDTGSFACTVAFDYGLSPGFNLDAVTHTIRGAEPYDTMLRAYHFCACLLATSSKIRDMRRYTPGAIVERAERGIMQVDTSTYDPTIDHCGNTPVQTRHPAPDVVELDATMDAGESKLPPTYRIIHPASIHTAQAIKITLHDDGNDRDYTCTAKHKDVGVGPDTDSDVILDRLQLGAELLQVHPASWLADMGTEPRKRMLTRLFEDVLRQDRRWPTVSVPMSDNDGFMVIVTFAYRVMVDGSILDAHYRAVGACPVDAVRRGYEFCRYLLAGHESLRAIRTRDPGQVIRDTETRMQQDFDIAMTPVDASQIGISQANDVFRSEWVPAPPRKRLDSLDQMHVYLSNGRSA
jgi:hypothetical protein